ncbi:GAF domain-containing protein [Myxococcota bacterium]|nr:GAF domain-containing protein [Myxococcota bacterium]
MTDQDTLPGHLWDVPAEGEEILEAVLRGAAKLLGCSSASLIFLDQEARVLRVRVGITAVSNPSLAEVESLLGSIRTISRPMESVRNSLLYVAWRDRVAVECSSLTEMAGGAFPAPVLRMVDRLLGDHRFVAVPVIAGDHPVGLVLFEKSGARPFSPQQREVMVRYARRLGEIVRRERDPEAAADARQGDVLLLAGPQGRILGGNRMALSLDESARRALAARAWKRLEQPGDRGEETLEEGLAQEVGTDRIRWDRLRIRGQEAALVRLERASTGGLNPRDRWMRLALGERQATLLLGPDLEVTSCNPDAEALFGAEPGGLHDRPVWDFFPSREAAQALLNRQMLLNREPREEVVTLRRLDGTPFTGRTEWLLLADGEGRTLGFLMGIRETLEEEWEGDAGASPGMIRQERLVSMGQMAAQMAHEIRNPLLAIGATLQVLSREDRIEEESRGMLTAAAAEITRLDMLLKDYLSLAVRHGAVRTPVDLVEVTREVISLLRHSPKAQDRTLVQESPESLPVLADPDGLRHVLFNLVLNALEATAPGGRVRVRGALDGEFVLLEVEDDGVGLPPVDPASLFEPFVTTKRHGTGLGLSVVRQVVEAHEGRVDLGPGAGKGTRATVRLPRRMS